MRLVDKIEKISAEAFAGSLVEIGLDETQIRDLVSFTTISGSNSEILDQLSALGINTPDFQLGLENLKQVTAAAASFGIPENRLKIDLKIARGLDYYTGTVYETNLIKYPEIGSICSGGRYDNLAEFYTDRKLPGVGISIGLSRLFYALRELGLINSTQKSPAQIAIFPMTEADLSLAIATSKKLRDANISNILYSEPDKMKKKLSYADRMGLKFAIIIGESERTSGLLSVKNLTNGKTTQTPLEDLPNLAKNL